NDRGVVAIHAAVQHGKARPTSRPTSNPTSSRASAKRSAARWATASASELVEGSSAAMESRRPDRSHRLHLRRTHGGGMAATSLDSFEHVWASARAPAMTTAVDPHSPTPLYRQLADLITADIESGTLKPDQLVPSESYLMQQYGLSRGTVCAAVRLLRERRLVY